jgi:hypothetical protein
MEGLRCRFEYPDRAVGLCHRGRALLRCILRWWSNHLDLRNPGARRRWGLLLPLSFPEGLDGLGEAIKPLAMR